MSEIKHAASEFVLWKKPEVDVAEDLADELYLRFEIDLCESMLRARPGHLLSLLIVGHLYTRIGKHDLALATDQTLIALLPEDATVRYNLACSHSNLNHPSEALTALDQAIELGYRDFDFIEKDPDLENLRKDPRFSPFLQDKRSEHESEA